MTNFKNGQSLIHPEHGPCTVAFVGQSYVGVEFEGGAHALFRKEAFNNETPQGKSLERMSAEPDGAAMEWPESTFISESPDAKHFMGSHWEPFVDDMGEILSRLPEIAPEARRWLGFGEVHAATRTLPDHWMQGFALTWPGQRQGLMLSLICGRKANEIVSLFPFLTDGGQHTLKLDKVIVWDGGAEAHIEAAWGESEITFFDVGFLVNRLWYETGRNYEFILSGIAYNVQRSTVMEIPSTRHPDDVAWEIMLAEKFGQPRPEISSVLNLRGMVMFLPAEGWDADDYKFRGPVKSVKKVDGDVLGQTGWIVRTTVMRFREEEADLDILITRRAWKHDQPPSAGQDIEGSLWLQGYLWDTEDFASGDPKR